MAWLVGLALSTASTETDDDSPEVVRQRARLYRGQADAQALKNQVARGELLPAEEVVAGWQAAVGRSRALMLGVPPAVAAQLVMAVREHEGDAEAAEKAIRGQLVRAIDGALNELANTMADDFDDGAEAEAGGDGTSA